MGEILYDGEKIKKLVYDGAELNLGGGTPLLTCIISGANGSATVNIKAGEYICSNGLSGSDTGYKITLPWGQEGFTSSYWTTKWDWVIYCVRATVDKTVTITSGSNAQHAIAFTVTCSS